METTNNRSTKAFGSHIVTTMFGGNSWTSVTEYMWECSCGERSPMDMGSDENNRDIAHQHGETHLEK